MLLETVVADQALLPLLSAFEVGPSNLPATSVASVAVILPAEITAMLQHCIHGDDRHLEQRPRCFPQCYQHLQTQTQAPPTTVETEDEPASLDLASPKWFEWLGVPKISRTNRIPYRHLGPFRQLLNQMILTVLMKGLRQSTDFCGGIVFTHPSLCNDSFGCHE